MQTKVQDQMASLGNPTTNTKKNSYQSFSNSSERLKRRRHSQSHSMKLTSPWHQTRQRHYKKKKKKKEIYRPISLNNTDAKLLNKIFVNWIQKHIKRILYCDQIGFIPWSQEWLYTPKSVNEVHDISKRQDKNHKVMSIDAEKECETDRHSSVCV